MIAFIHLPHTSEGWSATATVVSALTALLNLIVIVFLARYSIRQTFLLARQTEAIIAQTKLMMKEREKNLHRDTYLAVASVFKIVREISEIRQCLAKRPLQLGERQTIRPIDWHLIASSLVLAYPAIQALPAQMDVEMTALDDAIKALQVVGPEGRLEAELLVARALSSLSGTADKVLENLNRGINPEEIMVTTASRRGRG